MNSEQTVKYANAVDILRGCLGTHGVWADAGDRYRYQCWTRDLNLAAREALGCLGHRATVGVHLEELARRQRPDGRVPIVFLDGAVGHLAFLRDKFVRSIALRRPSFMLRRYLAGKLWDLTPGTRDSELHFAVAALEHARWLQRQPGATRDDVEASLQLLDAADGALAYVREHLVDHEGLPVGCDWRDTMQVELRDARLLTNACLLYRAYQLSSAAGDAATVRAAVRRHFWSRDGHLVDWPGANRVDPLGASLAVLYDVVGVDVYPAVLDSLRSTDTPCGVAVQCEHAPFGLGEAAVVARTRGHVVWPFVVGYAIRAAAKMARVGRAWSRVDRQLVSDAEQFAHDQFNKLTRLPGHREWYAPDTGEGCGAKEQMWSAALYVTAAHELGLA